MTLTPEQIEEIAERASLYERDDDAATAASFFDPDGYKAHLDRSALLTSHRELQERVEALEASRNGYYDEAAKAFAALATIIRTYDSYRGMGVLPAPTQYQQVVETINDARKIMAPQFREASRLLTTKGE